MPPEKRTFRVVVKELISHPFFPLLFFAEAAKEGVTTFTEIEPVVAYTLLAIWATLAWVLSDSIEIGIKEGTIVGNNEKE